MPRRGERGPAEPARFAEIPAQAGGRGAEDLPEAASGGLREQDVEDPSAATEVPAPRDEGQGNSGPPKSSRRDSRDHPVLAARPAGVRTRCGGVRVNAVYSKESGLKRRSAINRSIISSVHSAGAASSAAPSAGAAAASSGVVSGTCPVWYAVCKIWMFSARVVQSGSSPKSMRSWR